MEPILVMESIWAPTLEWSEYWNGANIGMERILEWSEYWDGANIGMERILVVKLTLALTLE